MSSAESLRVPGLNVLNVLSAAGPVTVYRPTSANYRRVADRSCTPRWLGDSHSLRSRSERPSGVVSAPCLMKSVLAALMRDRPPGGDFRKPKKPNMSWRLPTDQPGEEDCFFRVWVERSNLRYLTGPVRTAAVKPTFVSS
jgi:hypothetical protein